MRTIVSLVCCFVLFCVFVSPVHASDLMEDLIESAGLDRLEEVVPETMENREALIAAAQDGTLAAQDVTGGLFSSLWASFRERLSGEFALFASLFGVLFLCAFLSAMRQAFLRDAVMDVVELVSVLLLAGISYGFLSEVVSSLKDTLTLLASFMSGMIPITGAIYTVSGGVVTQTVQSSLLLSALNVMESVLITYLMPAFSVLFALSAAGAVSGVDLSGIGRFLRRTVGVALSGIFLILLALLALQTRLGAASDTLTLRSARFAAANFIPAVGGMFSESAKTVFSAVNVLRTGIGGLGCTVVLWIVLSPIVMLLVRRVLFSLCAAVASMFHLEREGRLLTEFSEIIGLLLGVLLSSGVFFLLAFGVFLSVPIGG